MGRASDGAEKNKKIATVARKKGPKRQTRPVVQDSPSLSLSLSLFL